MSCNNFAKIACSYFMRSKTLFCRVYSNIKNEETIHKIARSLWVAGSHKIKRKRKVQVLFVSYRGKVDVNPRPVFVQTEFEISEPGLDKIIPDKIFKCTKKQANRIEKFLLNSETENGSYISDDEDFQNGCLSGTTISDNTHENKPKILSDIITNDDVSNSMLVSQGKIVQLPMIMTQNSITLTNVKEDENFKQNVDDIIDDESLKNVELLKSIKYIYDGKFTIHGDRLFLDEPCGHAYGDFIKNRGNHYFGCDGYELCISRIRFLDRFIQTVEPVS